MAYKDEYEVARLLLAPEARAAYEAVGGPGTKVTWRLHPPMLRAAGMKQKMKLGPQTKPVLAALARSKRLRGTRRRPVPLGRGAQAGAGDDPRVRGRRAPAWPTRLTADNLRRGRRDRLAARPGPRLRAHQARPRHRATAGARRPPGRVRADARDRPDGVNRPCGLDVGRPATESGRRSGDRRGVGGDEDGGADDAGLVLQGGRDDLGADVDVRQPLVGLPAGAAADDDQRRARTA